MGKYKNALLFLIVISVFWSNSALSTGSGSIPSSYFDSSSIFPVDGSTEIYYEQNSGSNYLTISAPNEHGISLNEFSQFDSTETLQIVNTHRTIRTVDGEKDVEPARLIVISSQEINLAGSIEIIGPPTDIIFISSQSNGYITCPSCSIQNSLRVSFIAGVVTEPLSSSSSEIGEIISDPTSYISIDYLKAPGLVSLDILANQITLTGLIDINQSASQTDSGAYFSDPDGNLSIGTGSVNLLMGGLTWNYDDNLIKSIGRETGNIIKGRIASSAVKIASVGALSVFTLLDTRTDLLSSVSYKQGTYVPLEGIDIQTLRGDLKLFKKLKTTGDVNLKSTGAALLLAEPYGVNVIHDFDGGVSIEVGGDVIHANVVTIIAGGVIDNRKDIKSRQITMEGLHVFNEGRIVADEEISLLSDEHLANHFGGLIKSKTVRLQSKNQAVINGARYPYRHRVSGIVLGSGRTLLGRSVNYQNLLMGSLDYTNRLNPSYLGTFYTMQQKPITDPDDYSQYTKIKAPDLGAQIVAESFFVKSVGFENINPYYALANVQGDVDYNADLANQVSITVEDYAAIDARDYFVNSSAKFEINNQDSLFAVDTGIFINERYRTVSLISHESPEPCLRYASLYGELRCVSTYYPASRGGEMILWSDTLVNSPPGRVSALGNMKIKSSVRTVNNVSYIEVYGNADIDSPYLDIFGFENEAIFLEHNTHVVSEYVEDKCRLHRTWGVTGGGSITIGPSCSNYVYTTRVNDSVISTTAKVEGDSLFLINGNLNANASIGWFKTHNPINGLYEKLIIDVVAEEYPEYIDEYLNSSENPDWVSDVDEVNATAQISIFESVYWVFVEIYEMIEELSDAIVEFYNELVWWE